MKSRRRQMRRIFFWALFHNLRIIWPILSGVFVVVVSLGILIAYIEEWRVSDALYFTFVTGLTIGYGDLTPKNGVARFLSVVIGFSGIIVTGLVAAVAVKALDATAHDNLEKIRAETDQVRA